MQSKALDRLSPAGGGGGSAKNRRDGLHGLGPRGKGKDQDPKTLLVCCAGRDGSDLLFARLPSCCRSGVCRSVASWEECTLSVLSEACDRGWHIVEGCGLIDSMIIIDPDLERDRDKSRDERLAAVVDERKYTGMSSRKTRREMLIVATEGFNAHRRSRF